MKLTITANGKELTIEDVPMGDNPTEGTGELIYSKVKTVKQIAAADIERMNSAAEFVESVISENRLNQGIDKMREMGLEVDIKNTGAYIKWVVNDGLKEEMDVIVASAFEVKELTPLMSVKAKNFWFEQLQKV